MPVESNAINFMPGPFAHSSIISIISRAITRFLYVSSIAAVSIVIFPLSSVYQHSSDYFVIRFGVS